MHACHLAGAARGQVAAPRPFPCRGKQKKNSLEAGRDDDDDETPHDVTRVVAGEAKGPRRRARFWRRNAIWSCGCGARLPAARARCTVVGVGAVARPGVFALLVATFVGNSQINSKFAEKMSKPLLLDVALGLGYTGVGWKLDVVG